MKGGLYSIVIAIAFFFTLAFVTNFQAYIHSLRIGIFPYHWFIAASGIFLLFSIFSGSLRKIPRPNTYLILWFLTLNFLMLLSLLLITAVPESRQVYIGVSLFSAIAVTYTMLLTQPRMINACGTAVAVGVCILVVVSYMEFFNPNFNIIDDVMFGSTGTKGVAQRVGGLYENPNANGYAMALGMFIGQFFLPRTIRFIFAVCVGLAILATVSRSALILWTFIIFTSFWMGVYSKGSVLPKFFSILFVAILVGLLTSGQLPYLIEAIGLEQYVNKGMMERLSGGFLSQEDGSTLSRKSLISENLSKFYDNPLFGSGLGSSAVSDYEGQGSHNMALRMAVEMGIIGLLIYLSLLVVPLITKSFIGFIFISFYFIANLFTHTSFEQPVFAVLIPLSILAYSSKKLSNTDRNKKHRKRRRKSRRTTQSNSPSSPIIS